MSEMTSNPPSSGIAKEKSATTLELFFDLVFVFAITQVVGFIVHHPTWPNVFRATILLGILWWGWTIWAWVTNIVSLEPRVRRLVVLSAMVGLFIIAQAVPFAFEGHGAWVAIPYVLVTTISSVLVILDAITSGKNLGGLLRFAPISLLGGILLIAGSYMGGAQQWVWLAGLLVNVAAAALSSRAEWNVDAKHFAERHGLILIIALGEAIIAVGATLADKAPSWELAAHLTIGLIFAMTLYWAYFDRAQQIWEERLREASPIEAGRHARDVYTFTHFPMIVGIVLSAVALEEAFLHPTEPLGSFVGGILILGTACYFLGIAAAAYRSAGVILRERIVAIAAIAAVVLGASELAGRTLVIIVTAILLVAMAAEHVRFFGLARRTDPKTA